MSEINLKVHIVQSVQNREFKMQSVYDVKWKSGTSLKAQNGVSPNLEVQSGVSPL